MDGWIKLYRKLINWEWYDHIPTKVLFIHLLLKANHKPGSWRGQEIKTGQLITGRHMLAKETGLSESQVRTALRNLESSQEIIQQATNQFSLITVCNYGSYQGKEEGLSPADYQQEDQQISSKSPANLQQATTNKNEKNDKNEKNKGREQSSPRSMEQRKKDFKLAIWEAAKDKDYPTEMLRAFYDYWTEAGPKAKKLRFEKQSAFEIEKRLATWARRDKDYQGQQSRSKGSGIKPGADLRGKTM